MKVFFAAAGVFYLFNPLTNGKIMSRALATITRIRATFPIEGADNIEAVTMTTNGWTCVAKKGDFQVGDYGVYFEIDSFLPKEERYAFLEGKYNKVFNGAEGYRLKTIKLRGQISQGLVLPMSDFPEIAVRAEGRNMTDILKVQLYELPTTEGQPNAVGGKFPSFIWKTDQERFQSLSDRQIAKLYNKNYEVTEKIDGRSATYYVYNGHFGICSRNLELTRKPKKGFFAWLKSWFCKETCNTDSMGCYGQMAKKYNIEKALTEWCITNNCNIAIQGEIVGPGIQENRLKLKEVGFYVFDIFDIDKQVRVDCLSRQYIVEQLGLRHVPIIDVSFKLDFQEGYCIADLINQADGKSELSDQKREGLVYKQRGEVQGATFKIISNAYLLKTEK
jgi:RNA ligase (TIGR02306 family)